MAEDKTTRLACLLNQLRNSFFISLCCGAGILLEADRDITVGLFLSCISHNADGISTVVGDLCVLLLLVCAVVGRQFDRTVADGGHNLRVTSRCATVFSGRHNELAAHELHILTRESRISRIAGLVFINEAGVRRLNGTILCISAVDNPTHCQRGIFADNCIVACRFGGHSTAGEHRGSGCCDHRLCALGLNGRSRFVHNHQRGTRLGEDDLKRFVHLQNSENFRFSARIFRTQCTPAYRGGTPAE